MRPGTYHLGDVEFRVVVAGSVISVWRDDWLEWERHRECRTWPETWQRLCADEWEIGAAA